MVSELERGKQAKSPAMVITSFANYYNPLGCFRFES